MRCLDQLRIIPRRMLWGVFVGIACASTGCGPDGELSSPTDDGFVELEFPDDSDETPSAASSLARTGGLTPGESFTFRRRLEQRLEQQLNPDPVVSTSTLQIDYVITFEGYSLPPEFSSESTEYVASGVASARRMDSTGETVPQFRVRFQQIQQRLELPGRPTLEFDSAASPASSGEPLLGCQGMKDNGFRFWLSPRSELLAVDDFSGFLDRCAQTIGESSSKVVFRRLLETTWGTEGPTQFLSDFLGVIAVRGDRPGARWAETRTLNEPVAMRQSTEFELTGGRGEFQSLEWRTRLNPVLGGRRVGDSDVSVRLTRGEATGSASIDRRSGLPVESQQNQTVRMQVRTAGGREFVQAKTTTVRIERLTTPAPTECAGRTDALNSNRESPAALRISQRRKRDTR